MKIAVVNNIDEFNDSKTQIKLGHHYFITTEEDLEDLIDKLFKARPDLFESYMKIGNIQGIETAIYQTLEDVQKSITITENQLKTLESVTQNRNKGKE